MKWMINLGCGKRFHAAWRNFDLVPGAAGVERWDVRERLPLPDESCTVCYSSHLLEHLTPTAAAELVGEMGRVLDSGGILRLVVPDLEVIVRQYLRYLELIQTGRANPEEYEWAVLELLDQLTRDRSGGGMAGFLSRAGEPARGLALQRWGVEAVPLLGSPGPSGPGRCAGWRRRMQEVRSWLTAKATGLTPEILAAARFRASGEIHRWMYDRYSLGRVLERNGFTAITRCSAGQSGIPQWLSYGLDCDAQGVPHKPDSLYLEARKP